MSIKHRVIFWLYCFSTVIATGPVTAATFTVNSAFDVNDLTPGNGLCVAYLFINPPFVLPFCTLRAAIEETNALPGADTINVPRGVFTLSIDGTGENRSATGDLDITDSLTIIGAGAEQTFIDAKFIDRIFDVVASDIDVVIRDVTLFHGRVGHGAIAGHRGGGGSATEEICISSMLYCSTTALRVTGLRLLVGISLTQATAV